MTTAPSMDALQRLNRIADRWTPKIVVLVIAAAFVLSYAALLSLAIEAGYHAWLAWLWPLVLDGVVIAASLSLLKRQARGDSVWYSWLLLIAFDGASIWLNAIVADDLVFSIIHGLPPLTLVLLLKLYTGDIKSDAGHVKATRTLAELTGQAAERRREVEALAQKLADLADKREALAADIADLRKDRRQAKKATTVTGGAVSPLNGASLDNANEARADKIEQRRGQVLDLLKAGLDKRDIAAELDVSPRTVSRDIKTLNGQAMAVTK